MNECWNERQKLIAVAYLVPEEWTEKDVDSSINVELEAEVRRGDRDEEVGDLFDADVVGEQRSSGGVGHHFAVHLDGKRAVRVVVGVDVRGDGDRVAAVESAVAYVDGVGGRDVLLGRRDDTSAIADVQIDRVKLSVLATRTVQLKHKHVVFLLCTFISVLFFFLYWGDCQCYVLAFSSLLWLLCTALSCYVYSCNLVVLSWIR